MSRACMPRASSTWRAEPHHRLRPAQEGGGLPRVEREPGERLGDEADQARPAGARAVDGELDLEARAWPRQASSWSRKRNSSGLRAPATSTTRPKQVACAPARRAGPGAAAPGPTPPATITQVAADGGVEVPAHAVRPADADHGPPGTASCSARLTAPTSRMVWVSAPSRRGRVAADRDRDLADAGPVEHRELAGAEGRDRRVDRLQAQGRPSRASRPSGRRRGRAGAASASRRRGSTRRWRAQRSRGLPYRSSSRARVLCSRASSSSKKPSARA